MPVVGLFLDWYQKLGLENLIGLSARTKMSLLVAEGFVRLSYHPDYESRLAALLDPLDEESRSIVLKVIDRHHYIFTNNLLQHRRLYDAEELTNRATLFRELPLLADKMGIPRELAEASVLWYHHGLRHTDLPVNLFLERIAQGDMVDVGAACGDSTSIFHQYYPCRHIHSFEPGSERLKILHGVIAQKKLDRVTVVEAGLGEAAGNLPDGSPIEMLDDYVARNNLQIGLVKMDVEGAEGMVLKGAVKVLREQKPLLIVSMYHNADQFFELLPLIGSLQPDYRFAVRKLDDRSPVFETTLFCF